jgi:hypothetical protein
MGKEDDQRLPLTGKEVIDLDKNNGRMPLNSRYYRSSDFSCGSTFQKMTLHISDDVLNHNFHGKAHLVAGGHLVDVIGHDIYSSTVKSISI